MINQKNILHCPKIQLRPKLYTPFPLFFLLKHCSVQIKVVVVFAQGVDMDQKGKPLEIFEFLFIYDIECLSLFQIDLIQTHDFIYYIIVICISDIYLMSWWYLLCLIPNEKTSRYICHILNNLNIQIEMQYCEWGYNLQSVECFQVPNTNLSWILYC